MRRACVRPVPSCLATWIAKRLDQGVVPAAEPVAQYLAGEVEGEMKITNGKDFWAGVMFIAFGLGFMIVARNYAMGNAVRMGPAYFPTALGGILVVLGAVVFLRAFVSKVAHPLRVFPFRFWNDPAGLALGVVAYFKQRSLV